MKVADMQVITIDEAVKLINANTNASFIWYSVVNEIGNIFELSGTSKEIQAVIPYYDENSNIVVYSNGYSTSKYYLREYEVSTPNKRYQLENPLNRDEFIHYIKTTDFRNEILVVRSSIVKVEKVIESYHLK
jgi:hypothetical protein